MKNNPTTGQKRIVIPQILEYPSQIHGYVEWSEIGLCGEQK